METRSVLFQDSVAEANGLSCQSGMQRPLHPKYRAYGMARPTRFAAFFGTEASMKARLLIAGLTVVALGLTTACQKKMAAVKPPPPPRTESAAAAATPVRHAPAPAATPAVAASNTNRMPDAATKVRIQDLLNRIQDAYFDFDRHNIRSDAQQALAADAKTLGEILKQYPAYKLTIQGNCDERGSDEFNLALGDARAKEAKDYLASLGVPASQLETVSFGKEHPVCTDHDESCWQKNRRAHITQEQKS